MEQFKNNRYGQSVVSFQINDSNNIMIMTNAVFTMAVVNILLEFTTLEKSVYLILVIASIKVICLLNAMQFRICIFNAMKYCDEIINHLTVVNRIKDITELTTYDIVAFAYNVEKKSFTVKSVIAYAICFLYYISTLL